MTGHHGTDKFSSNTFILMELLKRSLFKSDEAIKLLFHGDAFVPKIQQALQSTVEVAKLSSGPHLSKGPSYLK